MVGYAGTAQELDKLIKDLFLLQQYSTEMNGLIEYNKYEPSNNYTIQMEALLSKIQQKILDWNNNDQECDIVQAIAIAKCKRTHFEENVHTKGYDKLKQMLAEENLTHQEIVEDLLKFM